MKKDRVPHALSHLYLHVILSSMTELVKIDPDTQTMIQGWDFCLDIGVMNHPPLLLKISDNQIRLYSDAQSSPVIKLRFLTHHHLNRFFGGTKWKPPVVVKGLTQLKSLQRFSMLSERLSTILLDKQATNDIYTQLIFYVIGLGVLTLAQFDPVSQHVLQNTPYGLAQFTIGQEGIQPIWFEHAKEGCRGGQGIPPRSPDVKVNFTDMRTANEAFRNQIDTLAAVGAGRIKLEGLIPLADNLSLIMDRLDLYLQ